MKQPNDTQNIVIYQDDSGAIRLDVIFDGDNVWLTIEQMSLLFNKAKSTINEHILHIYEEKELNETITKRKIGITDFSTKPTNYYNLDVIISVGYRVKSLQGTKFRIWATQRLREYIVKGYVLNEDRYKSGKAMHYFDELQEKIREIRLSEKFFYQKIKDIYSTSIDYDPKDEKTIKFFKIVQNKLIWAVSKQTASELVFHRINAKKPRLNMKSLDKKSDNRITKGDAIISKNYLEEKEVKLLGLLVEQYLAFAETMAQQQTPMYMHDWIEQLDTLLTMNKKELLIHAGKISHEQMVQKVDAEYSKYRKQQKLIEYKKAVEELERDIKHLIKPKKIAVNKV